MRRDVVLRSVVAIVAIMFIIALTFAYGSMRRDTKTAQQQTKTDQPVNEKAETANSPASNDGNHSSAQEGQEKQKSTDKPTAEQPAVQNSSIPTTGGGSAILPAIILSLLFFKYCQTRKVARSLQTAKTTVK